MNDWEQEFHRLWFDEKYFATADKEVGQVAYERLKDFVEEQIKKAYTEGVFSCLRWKNVTFKDMFK